VAPKQVRSREHGRLRIKDPLGNSTGLIRCERGRVSSYSPAKFVSVAKDTISGMPNLHRASTSHVERKNGTLRQWCKRLTRLTYAFSKKRENLQAALALHFAPYNFCRVHSSLRVTPAIEVGITDHVWSLSELCTDLREPSLAA
jgi:hypothetical protein